MGEKEGLYFVAYSKSVDEFEASLDRMSGINQPDGGPDNIFQISTPVSFQLLPSYRPLRSLGTITTYHQSLNFKS